LPGSSLPGTVQSLHDRPGSLRCTCAGCTIYAAAAVVIEAQKAAISADWLDFRGAA
jgi:hypothetical protein